MKFYFAGSFSRWDELKQYMNELEAAGHKCTSRWLYGTKEDHQVDVTTDEELSPSGPAFQFAVEDLEDIDEADAVVFFSSRDSTSKGRGGRHTEFGYALGEKPIFIIGRRECAFHALVPDVQKFHGFTDFMIALTISQPRSDGSRGSLVEDIVELG